MLLLPETAGEERFLFRVGLVATRDTESGTTRFLGPYVHGASGEECSTSPGEKTGRPVPGCGGESSRYDRSPGTSFLKPTGKAHRSVSTQRDGAHTMRRPSHGCTTTRDDGIIRCWLPGQS